MPIVGNNGYITSNGKHVYIVQHNCNPKCSNGTVHVGLLSFDKSKLGKRVRIKVEYE